MDNCIIISPKVISTTSELIMCKMSTHFLLCIIINKLKKELMKKICFLLLFIVTGFTKSNAYNDFQYTDDKGLVWYCDLYPLESPIGVRIWHVDNAVGEVSVPKVVSSDGKDYPVVALGFGWNDLYSGDSFAARKANMNLQTAKRSREIYIKQNNLKGVFGNQVVKLNCPSTITVIEADVFRESSSLEEIAGLPAWTDISSNMFSGCSSLVSLDFSKCTSIGDYAFEKCSSLKSANLPICTSIGVGAFKDCISLVDAKVPLLDSLISEIAFSGCVELKKFEIPKKVTTIERKAFYNCTNLESIIWHNKIETNNINSYFEGCKNLKSITIPDDDFGACDNSRTAEGIIPSRAFYEFRNLEAIDIPSNIGVICSYAFFGCEKLNKVRIPQSVKEIETGVFGGCTSLQAIVLPENIKKISSQLFEACSQLKSIEIPDSVSLIDNNSFWGCSSLESIKIGELCSKIGGRVFEGCHNIRKIVLVNTVPFDVSGVGFEDDIKQTATVIVPDGTRAAYMATKGWQDFKTIVEKGGTIETPITFEDSLVENICAKNWDRNGDGKLSEEEAKQITNIGNVFNNQKNITSFNELIYFVNLESIPSSAFSGCSSLQRIRIPNKVATIGNDVFNGCSSLLDVSFGDSLASLGEAAFYQCTSLETIALPNNLSEVGNRVFQYCENLKTVSGGENISSIGFAAFDGCINLENVILPKGLTVIARNMFQNCNKLKSINIPNGMVTIEQYAFYGCTSLNEIYISDIGAFCQIDFQSSLSNPLQIAKKLYLDGKLVKDVEFEEGIKNINNALRYYTLLNSIKIPSSVTSIASWAFYGNKSLTKVVSEIKEPFALQDCFSSETYSNGTLIVPAGCKFEYETTDGWRNFKDIVEAGSEGKTDFSVNVTSAGSLRSMIENLETSRVENLTIKGRLNGADIAYLVSKAGKVAHLESLDLKDVVLVPSNDVYATVMYGTSEAGMSTATVYYIISDDERSEEASELNGFGGYRNTILRYNNCLAGAFNGMGLRKVVMPSSIKSIGDRTFASCSHLNEVWFPNSVTAISQYACYNCSQLETIPSLANVSVIGMSSFEGCGILQGNPLDLSCARQVNAYAFRNCAGISSVRLSKDLESIGTESFSCCGALENVDFVPNSSAIFSRTSFYKTPWYDKIPTENGIMYMGNVAMGVEAGTTPRELTFRDGTISIAHEFFDGKTYEKIRTINLPNSIKKIGFYAFCPDRYGSAKSNIEFIELPNGLEEIGAYAFAYNQRLKHVVIPKSVKSVDDRAFQDCSALESAEFNNVICGEGVFWGCDKLQKVKVGENVQVLGENLFATCYNLETVDFAKRTGSTPLRLGKRVFNNLDKLTSLELPEGTDSIGEMAIYNCDNLSSLTLPNSLRYIAGDGISQCPKITSLVIPANVEFCHRGSGGFAGFAISELNGLKQLTVKSRESGVWRSCKNLETLVLEEGVRIILDDAFYETGKLTSVILPESIDSIGSSAFSDSGIEKITIPSNVKSIGSGAFWGCSNLKEANISEGVKNIGKSCFAGCRNLERVTIPSTLKVLNNKTFDDCISLASIYVYNPEPLKLINGYGNAGGYFQDVFDDVKKKICILYVPQGSADKYRNTTGWREFQNIVEFDAGVTSQAFENAGATYEVKTENTVAITDDKNVKGAYEIPETVTNNGTTYEVTSIGTGAFEGNTDLTEVKIPATVKEIGDRAFAGCTNLERIYSFSFGAVSFVKARTRADGSSSVFEGVNKETCIVYVPVGSLEIYRNAEVWKEFKNIVEFNPTSIQAPCYDRESFDIYDLSGRKVRSNVSSIDGLPHGVYIVNGKKLFVR